MRYVIFYRLKEFEKEEKQYAEQAGWFCTKYITDIKPEDFVVPRYSPLIYGYPELEYDLKKIGANILNTYQQHRYIADLKNYYEDLNQYTPETWFQLDQIPENGPFFLKGETNSKKFNFDSHCFAKNKQEAVQVYLRLLDDGVISCQNIYIRKFENLITYFKAPHDLPITKEFRFFILDGKIIGKSYYWAMYEEELKDNNLFPDVNEVPFEYIENIINIIGDKCRGYVIDVAQKTNNSWILIECNDLQHSGLALIDPIDFYKKLKENI